MQVWDVEKPDNEECVREIQKTPESTNEYPVGAWHPLHPHLILSQLSQDVLVRIWNIAKTPNEEISGDVLSSPLNSVEWNPSDPYLLACILAFDRIGVLKLEKPTQRP